MNTTESFVGFMIRRHEWLSIVKSIHPIIDILEDCFLGQLFLEDDSDICVQDSFISRHLRTHHILLTLIIYSIAMYNHIGFMNLLFH